MTAQPFSTLDENRRELPSTLRRELSLNVRTDARILVLGAKAASTLPDFLRDLAPNGQLVHETTTEIGTRPEEMSWDMIVDATAYDMHPRMDALLALLSRSRPGGLYLIPNFDVAGTSANSGQGSKFPLRELLVLGDIINGRTLAVTALPALCGTGHQPYAGWPVGKLQTFVQAVVDRLVTMRGGTIIYRTDLEVPALTADEMTVLADVIAHAEPELPATEPRAVSAMVVEVQRLNEGIARRDTDIAALERERLRLSTVLEKERSCFYNSRCARTSRLVRGLSGAARRESAQFMLAPVKTLLRVPRVRRMLRRIRDGLT